MELFILFLVLILIIINVIFFSKLTEIAYKTDETAKKMIEEMKTLGFSAGEKFSVSDDAPIQESIEDWIKMISKQEDKYQKLQYLEAAIKRFPTEKKLIIQLQDLLIPHTNNSSTQKLNNDTFNTQESNGKKTKRKNLLVQREALMRLRKHADCFVDHCRIDDLPFALQFQEQVVASMVDVVASIDEYRKDNIDRLLQKMDGYINNLKKKSSDIKLLEKIEHIDHRIDKNLLNNYPDFQKKYERLSKSLMKLLSDIDKRPKPEIKSVNEKALKDGKEVLKILDKSLSKTKNILSIRNKTIDGDQIDLKKITRLLSRHNSSKLLHTTLNYLRVAEADVFTKLSPKAKITFTKYMIQQSSYE